MQLIQPNVQKWRTTTFPFRSERDSGLLFIHSSMPLSSGAGIRIATGCWGTCQGHSRQGQGEDKRTYPARAQSLHGSVSRERWWNSCRNEFRLTTLLLANLARTPSMDQEVLRSKGSKANSMPAISLTASPLHNSIARKHFQLFNGLVWATELSIGGLGNGHDISWELRTFVGSTGDAILPHPAAERVGAVPGFWRRHGGLR